MDSVSISPTQPRTADTLTATGQGHRLLFSAFAVRGTAALTEPATYDARVRVVSSTATSTTLLSWRAL